MKKLLSVMLALIMSLSIATVFVACESKPEPEHTHTFATEWTSDDTHHWHKATCEHTDQISDKAEHSFGEDGKCTVCQKEKFVETTVSAEVWTSKLDIDSIDMSGWTSSLDLMAYLKNVSLRNEWDYKDVDAGDNVGYEINETDGINARCVYTKGKTVEDCTSVTEKILGKNADDTHVLFSQKINNGEPKGYSVKMSPTNKEKSDFVRGFQTYLKFMDYVKDKFEFAEYDDSSKSYKLFFQTATIEEGLVVENRVLDIECVNLKYEIFFADGEVVKCIIEHNEISANGPYIKYEIKFGGVSITVPKL